MKRFTRASAVLAAVALTVTVPTPAASVGLRSPCVIDVIVSKNILPETRAAAKRWNALTTTLEEWPYRLRVRAGKTEIKNGGIYSRGDITGIAVSEEEFRALERERGIASTKEGVDYVGHAGWAVGDSFAGFVVNTDAMETPQMLRNTVAHELGHTIGVTHVKKRGYLMNPYTSNKKLSIAEPSTWDIRTKAETNHYLHCWDR